VANPGSSPDFVNIGRDLQTMQPQMRARHDSQDAKPAAESASKGAGKPGWFPTLVGRLGSKNQEPKAPPADTDPLLAFPSENAPAAAPAQPARIAAVPAARKNPPLRSGKKRRSIIIASIVAAIAVPSIGVVALRRSPLMQFGAAAATTGRLTIDSRPAGSQVVVDGEARGVTPLQLALQPGAHTITIRSSGDERVVPLNIAAGADVTQYFEMKASEPIPVTGGLSIASDPPGARIAIDGKPRGVSPLTVADLASEPHKITLTNDAGSVERTVAVAAGSTTSVMFALPRSSGPVGGWLSIAAPFDVEIMENRDVIGASGATRIMLAAGHHDLVLANQTLGYQESRKIEVTAGQTTAIRVEAPKAALSVNARPWAEILVDGANVGQTPIANVQVSIGTHELTFRHPQLGDRKQSVVVTSKGPNRIAADLTK
jgi:PEGA domain-containing protein